MFSGRARFLNGVKRQFGKCAIARSRNSGATHQMLASNSKTWRGFYDPRHDDSDYRGLYRNDSRVRNLDRPHGLTGKIEIIR
jgi:hypothetical protein